MKRECPLLAQSGHELVWESGHLREKCGHSIGCDNRHYRRQFFATDKEFYRRQYGPDKLPAPINRY